MGEDFEEYVDQVRADNYLHWSALIVVVVWTETIFGWLAAAGAFIGLVIAIRLTNTIILATTGSLRATRFGRWVWVLLALLALVISSARIESVQA